MTVSACALLWGRWSEVTWSKAQRTAKNVAPGLLLPNLQILALGVLVVPSTFCFFPSPSYRTSLQAGKVGWHQLGFTFWGKTSYSQARARTNRADAASKTSSTIWQMNRGSREGLLAIAEPTCQPHEQKGRKQQPGTPLAPTCPCLSSAESVGSGLRYCGAFIQGEQGWRYQERW